MEGPPDRPSTSPTCMPGRRLSARGRWIGLDATSGLLTGEGHIPLACTAEPASAAPIAGTIDAPDDLVTEFDFANVVTRIHDPPRVTKPYSDEQWERILNLGEAVDVRLRASDVRLTMVGEPTFVSATDMDADEWNTDADGPTKYGLAAQLAERLATRFAPGALIRHAQGKWYPGSRGRAGASTSTGGPTASRSGRTATCSPIRAAPARRRSRRPSSSPPRSRRGWSSRGLARARLRGSTRATPAGGPAPSERAAGARRAGRGRPAPP